MAAEVEKYFETSVNPETIKSKALRMQAGSNEPPTEKPVTAGGEECNTVQQQPDTEDAVTMMDQEIEKGESRKGAARKVAEKIGMNEGSLRVAHQRAEKKKRPEPEPPIISDVKMSPIGKVILHNADTLVKQSV